MEAQKDRLKDLISHAKEYGFVFPSSEIYDGLAATYDYGQLGAELKNNIKTYWWKAMVQLHENIVGLDSAIFMHPQPGKHRATSTLSMTRSSTTKTPKNATAPMSSSKTISKRSVKRSKKKSKKDKNASVTLSMQLSLGLPTLMFCATKRKLPKSRSA